MKSRAKTFAKVWFVILVTALYVCIHFSAKQARSNQKWHINFFKSGNTHIECFLVSNISEALLVFSNQRLIKSKGKSCLRNESSGISSILLKLQASGAGSMNHKFFSSSSCLYLLYCILLI
jgi:hypothetical protein